jgi:hypothetical protein
MQIPPAPPWLKPDKRQVSNGDEVGSGKKRKKGENQNEQFGCGRELRQNAMKSERKGNGVGGA